jgi:outer membrane protein
MGLVRCSLVLALTTGLATGTLAAQATRKPTTAATRPPAAPQAVLGGTKIAFINVGPLLRGMPGYAQAESTWTKEATQANSTAEKLRAVFDSAVAGYQQAQATMSATDRAAREKALQASQDTLQATLQGIQAKVENRQRELLAPLQTRLKAIIDGVRAEGNYLMILDIGNTASANIVSYDRSADLTVLVAERLAKAP